MGQDFPGNRAARTRVHPTGTSPGGLGLLVCTGLGSRWLSFVLNDSYLNVLRRYLRKNAFLAWHTLSGNTGAVTTAGQVRGRWSGMLPVGPPWVMVALSSHLP